MDHDHFTINVAERVKPAAASFGPYHKHLFKVTLPTGRTKQEAVEQFHDFCARYPGPEYMVTLTGVVVRMTTLKERG